MKCVPMLEQFKRQYSCQPLLGVNLSPEFVNLYFSYASLALFFSLFFFFLLVAAVFWTLTSTCGSGRKKHGQCCAKYTWLQTSLLMRFLSLLLYFQWIQKISFKTTKVLSCPPHSRFILLIHKQSLSLTQSDCNLYKEIGRKYSVSVSLSLFPKVPFQFSSVWEGNWYRDLWAWKSQYVLQVLQPVSLAHFSHSVHIALLPRGWSSPHRLDGWCSAEILCSLWSGISSPLLPLLVWVEQHWHTE